MSLKPSSLTGTWKYQRWKEDSFYPNDSDVVSTNKAITYSCQIGELESARRIFDAMTERTVVSWNAMITGYSRCGMIPEAFAVVSLMHRTGVKLNETTFSMALSACGRSQSLSNGKQIQGLVLKSEHRKFKFVGSALLYVYANCCEIGDARKVFDELHQENELLWSLMLMGYVECNMMSEALCVFGRMPSCGAVEWTTLISGYARSEGGCKEALEMFRMMREGSEADPNEFTLDCVARVCGRLQDLWGGRVVHGLIMKVGFECEQSICAALISLYCNCELIDEAKKVYDGMLRPGLSDSNELIGGLLGLGKVEESELVERNSVSYNQMIKGYAMCGRVDDAERMFMQMRVRGLSTLNTMISAYARSGYIDKALELFNRVKAEGNPVSWNSMMTGYVHNDQHENAVDLYVSMRRSSVSQTRSTFSVLFHACSCMGSLQQGQLFHAHLEKTPFSCNVYAGTALIDMYSRCGSISSARAAFHCISSPNVAAWTALINGYAHHGLGSDATSLFDQMLETGIHPNAATFVAVLSACARAGLVEKGMQYFHLMKECYGTTPTLEHFTCVVDLLGRAGLVHEAEEFIQGMPVEADRVLFISLLHSSWSWMDMGVGERVAEKMLASDVNLSAAACVIMSNMYARSGRWVQKLKVRDILRGLGVHKDPGCSWIDVNNTTHVFCVDYRNHPNSDTIYATLESLKANFVSVCTSNRK